MNWDALGAIGEIVGAIAVVVTLIFLIAQLRLNTRALEDNKNALRVQTTYERSKSVADFHLSMFESEYLIPILAKLESEEDLAAGLDKLDAGERRRIQHYALQAFVRLEHQLYLHQQGLLDDEYYEYNTKGSIRQRYELWKALGMMDEMMGSANKMKFNPVTIDEIKRIAADT